MPKRGDVVLYTQGEKTYNALVMQANAVDASLLGENGEPTLHLAVIFDDPLVNGKPKAMPIGYIPQVSYVFDAVHASHEFSDEYKREHGLHDALPGVHAASLSSGILARRGAGEWDYLAVALEPWKGGTDGDFVMRKKIATAEPRTVEGADLGKGTALVNVDGGDMPLPMGRGAAAPSDPDPKE